MVNYGGKFEVYCEYRKKADPENPSYRPLEDVTEEQPLNVQRDRIMNYVKGRQVIVNLDKHEDSEEFLGDLVPPSKYRAKGSFVEFYDDFNLEVEKTINYRDVERFRKQERFIGELKAAEEKSAEYISREAAAEEGEGSGELLDEAKPDTKKANSDKNIEKTEPQQSESEKQADNSSQTASEQIEVQKDAESKPFEAKSAESEPKLESSEKVHEDSKPTSS